MKIRPTLEVCQQRFKVEALRAADLLLDAGPHDTEDRQNASIDNGRARKRARKERAALVRAMPMSEHRRKDLEDRQRFLIRTLRHVESPARRARHLAEAKHIADDLAADSFCQHAADRLGVAKRTVERAIALGARLLPDLAEAVADGPYDNPHDLARLAALPLEQQHAFARAVADHRYELLLAGEALNDGRIRKLEHAVLDALDGLGRNDSQTRRRLASLPQREAIETVAHWQCERDKHERRAAEINRLREKARASIRTTARQTAQVAYDAMTAADKADFLEVNGLTRALVIPGECISNAFDAVDESDFAQ
jgi:hypothetical protein